MMKTRGKQIIMYIRIIIAILWLIFGLDVLGVLIDPVFAALSHSYNETLYGAFVYVLIIVNYGVIPYLIIRL